MFAVSVTLLRKGNNFLYRFHETSTVMKMGFHLIWFSLQFLFEAAITHCVELATDRHGCCVLQKCLGYSEGEQKQHLVSEIASNALLLSQDPFGYFL